MGYLSDAGGESFTLTVPAEAGSVPMVRRAVTEALHKWGVAALIEDATLIASELVTNSVAAVSRERAEMRGNYGVDLYPASSMEISVWLYLRRCHGQELFICVDDACGDLPEMVADAGLGETGRGLLLVDTIAHRWGCRPVPGGGKSVWAALTLNSPR